MTDLDAAAVASARSVADSLDNWDDLVRWAAEEQRSGVGRKDRPAIPQFDNTLYPMLLRFLDSLGLTPKSRGELTRTTEGGAGELARIRENAAKVVGAD
jgi:hypothetical protein